jgi:peptidoglycan/xylan/chitin deacetylase (PgdA/CDA1 family)
MSVIRRVMRTASNWYDRLTPDASGLAILIYHRVGGGSASSIDLDVAQFEAQLEALSAACTIVSLDAGLDRLAARDPFDTPTVAITVDDGTADFCDHLVPALVRHQVPATLYVATRFVDEGETFPWGAPPASWAGLADTLDTGLVTIGSHTHNHRPFGAADRATAARELDRSIELIGEHLGVEARHFCYPKAIPPSAAAGAEVRHRFSSATLAGNALNRPGRAHPLRLSRSAVQRHESVEQVVAKTRGAGRLEGAMRALVSATLHRRDTV